MLQSRMLGGTPVLCLTALERKGRILTSTSSVKILETYFSILLDGIILNENVFDFSVEIKILFKSLFTFILLVVHLTSIKRCDEHVFYSE